MIGGGYECELIAPETVIPTRSRLVALPPLGGTTACRENLSSYYMRLADAHGVAPQTLAREVIFPKDGIRNEALGPRSFDDAWRHPYFNGIGKTWKLWVTRVEAATGATGLDRLTLGFLRGLATERGMVCLKTRWCPACFREGTPYARLLWSFQAVTCCPQHRIRLVDECGCAPDETLPWGSVKALPHICNRCGRDHGSADRPEAPEPTYMEIRHASMIADLLAGDLAVKGLVPKRGIPEFLADSIERHFEGNMAWLGQRIGVGKSTLHGWVHGLHLPDFGQIITLAEAHGCSIEDVLCGRSEAMASSPYVLKSLRPAKSPNGRKRKLDWDAITPKLEAMLQVDPPITMVEVGERLGVSFARLRQMHPVTCAAISGRWLEWRASMAAERKMGFAEQVREVAMGLASRGIQPTWRRIQDMGLSADALMRDRAALQVICKEVWWEFLMVKAG